MDSHFQTRSRPLGRARPIAVAFVTALALSVPLSALAQGSGARPVTDGEAPDAAYTPSAAGECLAGWQELPIPSSALESTPFEIITRKGKAAWIVGGSNSGPLVLRRISGAYRHLARGATGHRGFVGAVALGNRRILGAGYEREPEIELEPLIAVASGSGLSGRSEPRPVSDRAGLADIVKLPGGRSWVVGTRLYRGRLLALASRWDGKRWRHHHPRSGSGAGLLAIERAPGGVLWAVGWKEATRGRPRPLIGRWNGQRWSVATGPAIGGGTAFLTDVAFPERDSGYAVGYQVRPGSDDHETILFHWDGSSWTEEELPWADDVSSLPRAVSAGPAGELWIGGAQLATSTREARGFIAHRSGGTWEVDVLGVPEYVRSEVTDVAAIGAGAVAVAAVTGTALVLRTCESPTPGAERKRRIAVSAIARRVAADEAHEEDDLPRPAQPGDESTGPSPAVAVRALPSPVALAGLVVRDRTKSAGLAFRSITYSGLTSDLDDDGRMDVFIGRHGGQLPYVLLGRASRFRRISGPERFSIIDRHGCDAADIDRNGIADILCVTGRGRGKHITRHELTLDAASDGGRLDRSSAGLADPLGRGRVVEFIDLEEDGWPDVFIGASPDRDDAMPSLNRFYRNTGGTFVPAPRVGLDLAHGATCSWSGDIDRDGDEDLVYCTMWPTGSRPAGLRLMRNEGGTLIDRTRAMRVRPMGDIDVAFADVTGDGRKDMVQLSDSRLRVSRFSTSGYKTIWEAAVFDGAAIATGDANGDGRADIYLARGSAKGNRPDRLLISQQRGRRFASVRIPATLAGAPSDVLSIDYDANGLDDFVVLNGAGPAGPVKLLASLRR